MTVASVLLMKSRTNPLSPFSSQTQIDGESYELHDLMEVAHGHIDAIKQLPAVKAAKGTIMLSYGWGQSVEGK